MNSFSIDQQYGDSSLKYYGLPLSPAPNPTRVWLRVTTLRGSPLMPGQLGLIPAPSSPKCPCVGIIHSVPSFTDSGCTLPPSSASSRPARQLPFVSCRYFEMQVQWTGKWLTLELRSRRLLKFISMYYIDIKPTVSYLLSCDFNRNGRTLSFAK